MVGRPKKTLTKDELEKAMLENENLTDAADSLSVSYPVFQRERKRHGLDVERIEVTERDPDLERKSMTPQEFLDEMEKIDNTRQKQLGYKYFKYKFPESIALTFIGDAHLGSDSTEHYAFGKHCVKAGELPNVKVFAVGDFIDNFNNFSPKGGQNQQVLPIPRQQTIMEWIVKYLGEDLLGIVGGCHDEWNYKMNQFDLAKHLAHISGSIHFGHKAVLDLEVGENIYRFVARHKTRWYSSANLCHGLKKLVRWWESDTDLIVAAHRHIPDAEWFFHNHRMSLAVSCSSWKLPDRFLEQAGIPEAPVMSQTVVLDGQKREHKWEGMHYCNTIDEALRLL